MIPTGRNLWPLWVLTALLMLAAAVRAQAIQPDLRGTWDLTAAEGTTTPGDVLVFVRLTFSAVDVDRTVVFLSPNDGALSSQRQREAYRLDGDVLAIGSGTGATLVHADAAGTELTLRDKQSGSLFRFRRVTAPGPDDPGLVGTWTGSFPRNGQRVPIRITFDEDGSVFAVRDGERLNLGYAFASAYVVIDDDTFRYRVLGDHLELERTGAPVLLTRADD